MIPGTLVPVERRHVQTLVTTLVAATWRRLRARPVLAVGLVCVGIVLWLVVQWPESSPRALAYYPVKRCDFLISVVEGGTIKAVHEVTVRSELEGIARIISIATEGSFVRKGELLVELDSSDLRERIGSQEVTYQNTRFAALQAKEYLSIQKSITESNIKDAELKSEFSQTDLQKYNEGDWPQLKKNAETKIKMAEI